jgi:hypothetical protein
MTFGKSYWEQIESGWRPSSVVAVGSLHNVASLRVRCKGVGAMPDVQWGHRCHRRRREVRETWGA